MNEIDVDAFGYSYGEVSTDEEWALIYARKDLEAHCDSDVLDHPDGSVTRAKIADEVIGEIEGAKEKAEAAQDTADSAKTSAEAAQATVDTVQASVYSVQSEVGTAQARITTLDERCVYDKAELQGQIMAISSRMPNICKDPDSSGGDRVETHLTVGFRKGTSGDYSFSSGGSSSWRNQASGESSAVAASMNSTASGVQAVVLGGNDNVVSGTKSAAVGANQAQVSGTLSGVFGGQENSAQGYASATVGGRGLVAKSGYQAVVGKYNVADSASKYGFIVGCGTGESNRKNAFAVDNSGNGEFLGDVSAGGVSLKALAERVAALESKAV